MIQPKPISIPEKDFAESRGKNAERKPTKSPIPILTIPVKCTSCNGFCGIKNGCEYCPVCKDIGTQSQNIYVLKDLNKKELIKLIQKGCQIKKVSEITSEDVNWSATDIKLTLIRKHNLKEDDKVVITDE